MSASSRDAGDEAIAERIAAVRARIAAACSRAGRSPDEVTLVAVSKKQSAEVVAAGVRAGIVELGENYVQEARDKQARVHGLLLEPAAPGGNGASPASEPRALRWRMIGPLQRNKARLAARLFDAVDSVDRAELAEELGRRAAALGRELEICIQVNVSGESQKAGVPPEGAAALLEVCRGIAGLRVTGLMTVPAASDDPEATRPAFAQLRALRDRLWRDHEDRHGHSLSTLSMGMSADFEVAIEEGATHVRVGTAVFGARPQTSPATADAR